MSGATHTTDVAIIGAGPVGLFAIFELGMLKIKCHVIDTLEAVGGQCAALYPEKPIYDIPGYPEIDGLDLVKKLEAQAAPFLPSYHLGQQVVKMEEREDEQGYRLETSAGTSIHCKAVMIAAGCGAFGPNRPPLDNIEVYEQTGGIRYLVAQKDQFAGKKVVIAGGGDSAVDWALSLAPIAEKLYVVHRRDKFRAAPGSVDKMRTLAAEGAIEMVVPYQLDALEGDNGNLTGVTVSTLQGEKRTLDADYLLPFYGLAMELGPIAEWGLNLDKSHIAVDPGTMETNVPDVFAIGDIATYRNKLKLILCGFSEAAMAAHAIRDIVYPGEVFHFEYSTTSGVPGEAAVARQGEATA